MASALQNTALRRMTAHELALHLRSASAADSTEVVTNHLLGAVEQQSLPPGVYNVWLTASGSFEPIYAALRQPFSNHVRRKGILHVGRALRCNDWKRVWNELGGIEGLLSLFARLSVLEVRQLCKSIGRSARLPEICDRERREYVTALLQSLLPDVYEGSVKTADQRPLHKHYAQIVPACTPEFVATLLRSKTHLLMDYLPKERITQNHYPLLRRFVLNITDKSTSKPLNNTIFGEFLLDFLPPLCENIPQQPGAEPGFSASMSYAKELLRQLVINGDAYQDFGPSRGYFKRRLVGSMIRRMVRSTASSEQVFDVVSLLTSFLKQHDLQLDPDKGSLTFYVARYWSKSPEIFEENLRTLLGLQIYNHRKSFVWPSDTISNIEEKSRYPFLRLSVLCRQDLGYDIDEETGLKAFTTKVGNWPPNLFMMLQTDHSILLLRRLMQVRPEGTFLQRAAGKSILSHYLSPFTRQGDPHLLMTLLDQNPNSSARKEKTREIIKAEQSNAVRSRDQSDRANFAKSAAFYAIASGSLDLYGNITMWMRRFLRDPLTVKVIYGMDAVTTEEGVALLSGFPPNAENINPEQVRLRAIKGNEIVFQHLDSAILSLKEPSFCARDWRGVFRLFEEVVAARDCRAIVLQRNHNIRDDELSAILYADLIQVMLKAEKLVTQPGHEGLGFEDSATGSFFHMGDWNVRSPCTHMFFDRLAKARDDLWSNIRRHRTPAVVVLPDPWPRGLPLQHLPCLQNSRHEIACGPMPYIYSRAIAILYMSAAVALSPCPSHEEIRQAIGDFVDDYRIALKVYVMHADSPEARQARAVDAFTHAMGPLSLGRMSEEEAHRFWKPIFAEALPTYELPWKESYVEYPTLPNDVDPVQPSEWDPYNSKPPDIESRSLPFTVLDCMLHPTSSPYRALSGKINLPISSIPGVTYPPIFSHSMQFLVRDKSFNEKEGIIAAGVLIQALNVGEATRPLACPFPSEDDVRYPALFLDEQFIAKSEKTYSYEQQILQVIVGTMPPSLIEIVAVGAIAKLSFSTPASQQRTIFALVKLLATCDKPQLAADFTITTIFRHPDASAWHRQLLTDRYLHNLPATEAERTILRFTDLVLETLQSQSLPQRTMEVGNKGSESESRPVIKVTTVKMLAKLLRDANVLSPYSSVAALRKLFESSTHIDARVAVVESLLEKLARCKNDDAVAETILTAFQAVIPVAGSLNERSPMEEQKWAETEAEGVLPEVYYEITSPNLAPPILQCLQSHLSARNLLSQENRRRLLQRVILPILEQSIANNRRWVHLFLAKHSTDPRAVKVPVVPAKPEFLGLLLHSSGDVVPLAMVDLYHQWVLMKMSPSSEVTSLNEKISNDPSLQASNEGKHWLSMYGGGRNVYTSLPSLLKRPWQQTTVSNGIELAYLQDLVVQQAMILLFVPQHDFTHWSAFMNILQPPLISNTAGEIIQAWVCNAEPVLQRIIDEIERLRTPEWQKNRERRPRILPETFTYRLWLLDYPILHPTDPWLTRCAMFAEQLSEKLDEVFQLGISHHAKLREIQAAASRHPIEQCAEVACWLGLHTVVKGLDRGSPMLQKALLRVELADDLFMDVLKNIPGNRTDTLEEVRKIAWLWQQSEIEEIRMRGLRVGEYVSERAS